MLEATSEELKNEFRSAVIEGDRETENDGARGGGKNIFFDTRRRSPWTH